MCQYIMAKALSGKRTVHEGDAGGTCMLRGFHLFSSDMVEWAVLPQQQTPQQQIPAQNTGSILRSLLTPESPLTSPLPSSTPSLPDITPHRRPRQKKGRGQASKQTRNHANATHSTTSSTNVTQSPTNTNQSSTSSTSVTQSTSGGSNTTQSSTIATQSNTNTNQSSTSSTNVTQSPTNTNQSSTSSTNVTQSGGSNATQSSTTATQSNTNTSQSSTSSTNIISSTIVTQSNSGAPYVASSSIISANAPNTANASNSNASPSIGQSSISLGSTLSLTFRSNPKKSTNRVYEKGSLNQDADIFPAESRNKQCTAISYLAIVLSSEIDPALWTPSTIDALVKMGDELYRGIPHQHDEIEYEDLPKDVYIHPLQATFHAEQEWYMYGDLSQTTSNNGTYSLKDGVMLACKASSRCLVTAAGLTIAIINNSNNDKFYLSDSHKRGRSDGLIAPDGTAVLCQFSSIDHLCEHLQNLFCSSTNRYYSIGAFNIMRIETRQSPSSQQQFTKVIKTEIVGIANYIGQVR